MHRSSADPAKRSQPDGPITQTVGLRERKKQKTREAIQRAAMRLFQKNGYEGTTVEQIAAAAEISPSTFFNYFPTKEDVVLYDAYDPMTIEMFLERPKDEPLNIGLRRVLEGLASTLERDEELILTRARLIMEVPELRARIWDEVERNQVMVATLIAQRTGRSSDDFELRVIARVVIGAIFEASLEWMRSNGRHGLVELANRALDVVESGDPLRLLSQRVTAPAAGGAPRRRVHSRPRRTRTRVRS